MKRFVEKYYSFLIAPISIAPLVIFRIIIGFMLTFSTVRFMYLGWIKEHYISPIFHFKYYGFGWVEVAPDWLIYLIHCLMIVAALGVMLGFLYRISAVLLFILFTYTELLDLTYYLNHYYFVSLFCAYLIVVPANKKLSLDAYFGLTKPTDFVPRWSVLLFKMQLAIVYFYAGVAKINTAWLLEALPLKIWLPAHDTMPLIGKIFTWKITPYFFSWCGMLYDCFVPFLLYWRKTRLWAYLTVIFFHSITGFLFQIGVFPLVMIGATLIFFSDEFHQKIIDLFPKKENTTIHFPIKSFFTNKILIAFLSLNMLFQILFPWRYLLYDGNLFWTEEGYRFSWRVMLMEKAGTATFYVKDSKTGTEGAVDNSEFLNLHQEKQMAMQPDMILQFAHYLADYYKQKGVHEPQVRAEVYVTLNGKPSQLLIKPDVDLSKIQDSFAQKDWILHYD
ncbi:HTTM domain-containing protein [Flexibacter flexilis]|nr:HTTM domain-containing protein [Flexibacter flexilis]